MQMNTSMGTESECACFCFFTHRNEGGLLRGLNRALPSQARGTAWAVSSIRPSCRRPSCFHFDVLNRFAQRRPFGRGMRGVDFVGYCGQ